MQLIYTNAENSMLMARLDQGESITNFHGPTIIHIPVDPANAQYADIVSKKLKIDRYEAPPAPASFSLPKQTVEEMTEKLKEFETRISAIEARLPALSEQHHTH